MSLRRLLLPLLAALLSAVACDDAGGGDGTDPGQRLDADPAFFVEQRFDCDDASAPPSCPPGVCTVLASGEVTDCQPSCNVDQQLEHCTVFEGPDGFDLCVPRSCNVPAEGGTPVCDEACSEDDVTCYVFEFPTCS